MIKKCTCKHTYQDKKYGKGMRVWNLTSKGVRCTVCGKTIEGTFKKESKNG